MCKFFSFISDPILPIPNRFKYFNWKQRQGFLKNVIKEESPDSHTSIAHYYGYSAKEEDNLNKYEYNPLTNTFTVDRIDNKIDDRLEAEEWIRNLDFTTVVAPLIVKPIIHPFKTHQPEISPEVLELLRQWASVEALVRTSVRDSVWASVWDSVGALIWASVGDSVGALIWASVGDSVWALIRTSVWASVEALIRTSVWDSVGALIWDSVWDSVGALIWDSVGDSVEDSVRDSIRISVGISVGAYISSFIAIKYPYDYSPAIRLWEMGFVPVFDGKIWRLCGGEKGEILWKGKGEE